jgi:heptosyltransferase-1
VKIPEHDNLSILIVRLSAIGDIVFASPLIHALRQRYPGARISWLVQPESKALLDQHPELDEVVIWPRASWRALWKGRRWLSLWREVSHFRRSLREQGYDLALDVQGLLKSALLAWLSGATQRIGLGSREGGQYLMTDIVEKGGEPRRIGSEYLHLAEQLGLPVGQFEMHVGLSEEDQAYAGQTIERHQLSEGFVLICPFTTRPQKHWFNASWQALIEQVAENWDIPVVMLGGPGDRLPAAEIKSAGAARLVNLVGETSLRQAAALIARASLVVGVDTGLTHVGIAMNRPTLCLFGSTRPYLDTTHENAQVIYHPRNCSPCKRKPTRHGSFDCMAEITAAEIISQANNLPGFNGAAQ